MAETEARNVRLLAHSMIISRNPAGETEKTMVANGSSQGRPQAITFIYNGHLEDRICYTSDTKTLLLGRFPKALFPTISCGGYFGAHVFRAVRSTCTLAAAPSTFPASSTSMQIRSPRPTSGWT